MSEGTVPKISIDGKEYKIQIAVAELIDALKQNCDVAEQEIVALKRKYNSVVKDMALMENERNYYATYAAFGDSLDDEVRADIQALLEANK
jgi:hypothetical protein